MLAGMGALAGFHGGGGSEGGSTSTGSFAVSAAPSSISKTKSFKLPQLVTSSNVVVTATGGSPPYSHVWTLKSGDIGISTTAPSSDTTAFSATLDPGDSISAIFTDTVTDSEGATGFVDVPVTLTLVDSGP